MGFKSENESGVPKGRIVPMYLTDEGDLYPIVFTSEEQRVVVDIHTQINDPKEKLSIYNLKEKKKIL